MIKNHFAINMLTKGLSMTQSLLTKGVITTSYFEIISDGEVKKTGNGSPWTDPSITKDYLEKIGADTIKVYVDWYKNVSEKENISVDFIKEEIRVELLNQKEIVDIIIEVELIN